MITTSYFRGLHDYQHRTTPIMEHQMENQMETGFVQGFIDDCPEYSPTSSCGLLEVPSAVLQLYKETTQNPCNDARPCMQDPALGT